MKIRLTPLIIVLVVSILVAYIVYLSIFREKHPEKYEYGIVKETVYLPLPIIRKDVLSVEEALLYRRSIREYLDQPLTIQQLSQLLWATYGVNEPRWGLKTCPSAGGTYPLEIYVVVKSNGVLLEQGLHLEPGSYKYNWRTHTLILIKYGNLSSDLAKAALNQEWVREAPVNIIIAAVYERTTRIYGERGIRYVHMEVGHAGQNIYLEAAALNLGCVVVGAFHDDAVRDVVGLAPDETPLYIVPCGVPRQLYRTPEREIHEFILRNRGGG